MIYRRSIGFWLILTLAMLVDLLCLYYGITLLLYENLDLLVQIVTALFSLLFLLAPFGMSKFLAKTIEVNKGSITIESLSGKKETLKNIEKLVMKSGSFGGRPYILVVKHSTGSKMIYDMWRFKDTKKLFKEIESSINMKILDWKGDQWEPNPFF